MKNIIKSTLSKEDQNKLKYVTTRKISVFLRLSVLPKCIGRENAITKEEIFKKVFKESYVETPRHWLMWDFIRKGLHHCRKFSKCFVISEGVDWTRIYYIPVNDDEMRPYQDQMDSLIQRCRAMKRKAKKAIDSDWYLEPKNWVSAEERFWLSEDKNDYTIFITTYRRFFKIYPTNAD